MLRAILNKSWRQHPTRHQLYGYLPPITKTIQVRRTRHAGHCWDELISDVLLWNSTYGRTKAGRLARTFIQQLCEDTGCCPEELREAMNDREKWRERVRDIRVCGTTWGWWWWYSLKTPMWPRGYVSSPHNATFSLAVVYNHSVLDVHWLWQYIIMAKPYTKKRGKTKDMYLPK